MEGSPPEEVRADSRPDQYERPGPAAPWTELGLRGAVRWRDKAPESGIAQGCINQGVTRKTRVLTAGVCKEPGSFRKKLGDPECRVLANSQPCK